MSYTEDAEDNANEMTINDAADIWTQVDHGSRSLFRAPNTLVLKKGRYEFNYYAIVFSPVAVLLSYSTSWALISSYESFNLAFCTYLFQVASLVIFGYTLGQVVVTGPTKMFARYLYLFFLGAFGFNVGAAFCTSSIWWVHWLSYLVWGLAGLSLVYGLIRLHEHKSEVGAWKAIGPEAPRFFIIKSQDGVILYQGMDAVTEAEYEEIRRKKRRDKP